MKDEETSMPGWKSPRSWAALLVLVAAWFVLPILEDAIRHPVAHMLNMHMIQNGVLTLTPFAWEMTVRLALDVALLVIILRLLRHRIISFPLADARWPRRMLLGSAVGLVVMVAAIIGIVAMQAATISTSLQSELSASLHGLSWFAVDLIGAAGEELYGRGAVLLVAAAFLGWRGALVVSGVVFLILHLGSPGANATWLFRLFLQGVLLAYAVYRTGSVWWSVGYHAGWNWASAPLFGAAGSGYLDSGHIFDFKSTGSDLITGGAVGPEGSIFAFVAVAFAFLLLVLTTPQRPRERLATT